MVRFTAAVVVVGSMLLLPSAVALFPEARSSPFLSETVGLVGADLVGADLVPIEGLAPTADLANEVTGGIVASAGAAVDRLLCRDAVLLAFVGYGGTVDAVEPGTASFLLPWTETETVTRQVPVYETVTRAAGGLMGVLGQTSEVTRVVGHETLTTTVSETFDLAVWAEWSEEYVSWQEVRETVLVTLPVGLPFAALGQGLLVKVCDPSVPVLSFLPSQDTSGFDRWSPLPMQDGWYVRLLALDVHLASAEEAGELPVSSGWSLCPTDVASAIETAAGDLGLQPGTGLGDGTGSSSVGDAASGGEAAGAGVAPASAASGLSVSAAVAPALGSLAALAAVGLAAVAWRKLR